MDVAEKFGWTMDDLHERIAACEAVLEAVRAEESWVDAASLTFIHLCDEILSRLTPSELAVPFTVLRRLKRLDERLEGRQIVPVVNRLRSWLQGAESQLPAVGGPLRVVEEDGSLDAGAHPLVPRRPSEPREPERLRPVQVERWVALPQRATVRERSRAASQALAGFAMMLAVANATPQTGMPDEADGFGALERTRLALTIQAAAHVLRGPLVEKGLLRAAGRNAGVVERMAGAGDDLARTARQARLATEALLADLA